MCEVEEAVGGLIKMLRYNPSQTYADNEDPCSTAFFQVTDTWYVLSNPPIELSAQDPAIYQTFSASEAPLSPLSFGNGPSDAYLLDQTPPACTLIAQTPAYMQVGSTWYRHDRRRCALGYARARQHARLRGCVGQCGAWSRRRRPRDTWRDGQRVRLSESRRAGWSDEAVERPRRSPEARGVDAAVDTRQPVCDTRAHRGKIENGVIL